MKISLLVLLVAIIGVISLYGADHAEANHLAAPACSGYYGKLTATNWPGGKITVTCEGSGRQRGECVGESKTLSPGQSYHFSHCNCLDKTRPCVTVTGLPKGCTLKNKLACAANRQSIRDNISVTCTKPSPTKAVTKAPTKAPTGAITKTPTATSSAPTKQPTKAPTGTTAPTAPIGTGSGERETYVEPVWYCLMLGENVGDWVGCQKP